MPLEKYYCDYCDKHFQDTPSARRRHLLGLQHQRAKALWYSPQNLNRIHEPEFTRNRICHRFARTNSCPYGDSCKYYHPNKDVLDENSQRLAGTNTSFTGNPLMGKTPLAGIIGSYQANLPPSLLPPPEGGYPILPSIDWG